MAAPAVLLAVGVTLPGTAPAQTTLSGTYTSTVYLANYPSGNPFTLTAGSIINVPLGFAIYGGGGTAWTLTNNGTITSGNGGGINLNGGGAITNTGAAAIYATGNAIDSFAGAGTVFNQGTISSAHANGIYMVAGGTVTNSGTSARIDSQATGSGVRILGTGTVINDGTITGIGTGVFLVTGSVTNTNTAAVISGYIGVDITSVGGTVTNSGSISGSKYWGVGFLQGGTVINTGTNASISGVRIGVSIVGAAGTVTNSGTIAATGGGSSYGIRMTADGSVTNTGTAALITGFEDGISIGGLGTVTNEGTISATHNAGVLIVGGSVSNSNTGTISSLETGIQVDAAGTVTNAGLIQGTGAGGYGLEMTGGGLVTNTNSGTISGARGGIRLIDFAATLNNDGAISGQVVEGVYLGAGGAVTNSASGTIVGGTTGITNASGVSTITNFGSITGTIGVLFSGTSGDTLVNGGTIAGIGGTAVKFGSGANLLELLPEGVFTGTVNGGAGSNIFELGAGTLGNTGTLTTSFTNFLKLTVDSGANWLIPTTETVTTTAGVKLNGTLTNRGTIHNTVTIYGSGKLTNSGTIVNPSYMYGVTSNEPVTNLTNTGTIGGVYLQGGGTISNTGSSARISGTSSGILISSTGTITNQGTITGQTGFGIDLASGGNVTNSSFISGVIGVQFGGSNNTLINSGTVASTGGVAVQFDGGNDLLELKPGSAFTGIVDGAGGTNTIELAAGPGTGNVTDLGTSFTNFGAVTVDSGAIWKITGANNTIGTGVTLTNNGSLTNTETLVGDGAFYNAGLLTNSGSIGIGVTLTGTGKITNQAGAVIDTLTTAIAGGTGGNVVSNAGTILSGYHGIDLAGGGRILNTASGVIVGYNDGFRADAGTGTVNNYGDITGTRHRGVYLKSGGTVTNHTGAKITGGNEGVYAYGGLGTVTNSGTITGTGTFGVKLYSGGIVTNQANGVITGGVDGVIVERPGTVINFGAITATRFQGVLLGAAGTVVNHAGATITGGQFGVYFLNGVSTLTNAGSVHGAIDGVNAYYAAASVINSRTISGGTDGVHFRAGGTVTNGNGALITGSQYGVVIAGAAGIITNHGTIRATSQFGIAIDLSGASNGTIDNFGVIGSAGSTAIKFGTGTNELVVESGSSITGKVIADASANNTMVFVGTGTLVAGQFSNFQTTEFYDATWTLGSGETLTNTAVGVKHGTLTNAGSIGGSVSVGAGGDLINSGHVTGGTFATAVTLSSGGTVTNSGTIIGTVTGVQIGAGGSLTNKAGGLIEGGSYGVKIAGTGTLTNAGTIEDAPALNHAGMTLGDGAVLTNQATGTIGGATGVAFTGTGASLSNAGTITGSAGAGIAMNGTGANTLNNSGAIGGTTAGILVTSGTASITNTGTITATGHSGIGISFTGGTGTIDNFGTIDGASGTAIIFAGGTNELILENGGVLKGIADGSDGDNTLVIKGTAALVNANVTGFTSVAFDDATRSIGAGSTVNNAGVIAGTLINNGTLKGAVSSAVLTTLVNNAQIDDSSLTNAGLLTNSGTIKGGTVDNSGSIDNTGLITGPVNGIVGGGDITNGGTIIGTTGTGVLMNATGTLTNLAGGLIKGGQYGIKVGAGDVVSNAGTIEDDVTAGASIGSGAQVTNQTGGLITGVTGAIFTGTGASLTDSGTITGTGGVAVQFGSSTDTLTLDTGAVLNGSIDGGGGSGRIALQGTGTLNNTIANFGAGSTLDIASGANWTASGNWAIAKVTNSGILQPGIAGNPLKLSGDFIQSASATLRIVFAGVGQGSALQVNGTATLGGTVSIVATGTFLAAGQRYAIVTATNGIDGTFSNVTVSSGLLAPTLVYTADDAYLTLKQMPVGFPARTANQKGIAAAIQQAAPTSPALERVIGSLDQLSGDGVRATLDHLSGEVYTGFSTTAIQAGTLFMNQIQQQGVLARMGDPSGLQATAAGGGGNRFQLGAPDADPIAAAMDHPWGLWMSGFGQTGQFSGDGNTHTLNETFSGSSLGLDYQFDPSLRVGLAFGYGQTVFNLDNDNGRGKVDRKQVGLYAGYTAGPAYIDGLIGMAFGDGSATRDLSIPDLPARAKHDVNDTQVLASLEAGYTLTLPATLGTLTPFAGVTLDNDDQDGVTANGNALDLSVHSRSTGSARTQIGARFADSFQIGNVTLATDLDAGWAHEFARTARSALVALGGNAADSFQVYGAGLPGDSATVGLGLAAQTSADSTIYLRYDGDLAGSATTHTVTAGFRLTW